MNIALIGLGMVAATHVQAVQSAEKLHLSGVWGRDSAKTSDFAARHATWAFASVQEIAQDPAIDFVILATPPNARRDIVQELAAAGKPIYHSARTGRRVELPLDPSHELYKGWLP